MNTFARIIHITTYDKVSYYSVAINEEKQSLFKKFITNHEHKNRDKLYHIIKWIELIGRKHGAKTHLFRPEGEIADTSALPPAKRDPSYIENGTKKSNSLRLYCLRANEHVVFLFNGDLKTTQKAQDCENVKDHFKLANQITKALDEAFKQKNIKWNDTYTDIVYEDDLTIHF